MQDVLFIITARSGSKGIPNKNIKKLFGIPLLAIRGMSALSLTHKDNVWLSTDSKAYAQIGEEYGITVPFLRPDYLAGDTVPSSDVILHTMAHAVALGRQYKFIALLEPTSPFVYNEYLKKAIDALRNNMDASAIVATKKVESSSVFVQPKSKYLDVLAKNLNALKGIRRQDAQEEITPSGGFYISKWDTFLTHKTFYTDKTLSFMLPDECSLEIDSPIQFKWAEFLVQEKIVHINKII